MPKGEIFGKLLVWVFYPIFAALIVPMQFSIALVGLTSLGSLIAILGYLEQFEAELKYLSKWEKRMPGDPVNKSAAHARAWSESRPYYAAGRYSNLIALLAALVMKGYVFIAAAQLSSQFITATVIVVSSVAAATAYVVQYRKQYGLDDDDPKAEYYDDPEGDFIDGE